VIVHHDPVTKHRIQQAPQPEINNGRRSRGGKGNGASGAGNNGNNGGNGSSNGGNGNGGGQNSGGQSQQQPQVSTPKAAGTGTHAITDDARNALAQIAARTVSAQSTATGAIQVVSTPPAAPVAEPAAKVAEAKAAPAEAKATIEQKAPAVDAPLEEAIAEASAPAAAEKTAAPTTDETVAILDIPVTKAPRTSRRMNNRDAEQILDSVLGALPEPKQPGQGRSRTSRRAGSAGAVVSAPVTDD
jgi:ribonuclease E